MRRSSSIAPALLLFTMLGAGACATGSAASASTTSSPQSQSIRVVFGVRKPKHVGVATKTAHRMLAGEAEQSAQEVHLVVCGPGIRALATDSDYAGRVRRALEAGIRFKACGVTVERMGFDASRFVKGVEVVPNGFVELARLQEQGFHSVEL